MLVSCLRMSRNWRRGGKFSGRIFENGGIENSRSTTTSVIFGSNAASQRCGRSRVVREEAIFIDYQASSTRSVLGLQMHARHDRSSGSASAGTTYSTSPDFTATRHVPQPPARQPASIRIPFASAKSSSDVDSGFHWTVLFDFPKVTRSRFNMLVSLAVGIAVFSFTVAGPKASK